MKLLQKIVQKIEFMGKKKRSASSSRWLNEHFKDPFVQKAHKQKLRSRAYFKLDEIQQTDKLFKPGMTVVDLELLQVVGHNMS